MEEEKIKTSETNNQEKIEETKVEEKTKKFTIFGFTILQLLTYFVLYSILGFFVETLFGLFTKGVLESRKSFLYGPFCAIYGIGAVVMLVGLQKFKKNNFTLFIGGFIIGSIVEYIVSWVGEMIFHIKWWDYSNDLLNINGRICLVFSLFWGALAIFLMKSVQPRIDKMLSKFNQKAITVVTIILIIFLCLDSIITGFALRMFFTRFASERNLDLEGVSEYADYYAKLYENPKVKEIVDKFFNNEVIMKAFPNIKVTSKDGEVIWICDILTDIQPYYYRVFTPKLAK